MKKTGKYWLKNTLKIIIFRIEISLYFHYGVRNIDLKGASPISKVLYDDNIHVINNYLLEFILFFTEAGETN